MRKLLGNKKLNLLILVLFLITVLIVLLSYLFFNNNPFIAKGPTNTDEFAKEIKSQIESNDTGFKTDQTDTALNKFGNQELNDTERYEALIQLSFLHSSAYSATHNPDTRENAESIQTIAKKSFPELYKEVDFHIPCADPECGEKIEDDLDVIYQKILVLKIPIEDLSGIVMNFETASYIPSEGGERDFEKIYGFGLAMNHLYFVGDIEASSAATMLENYLNKNYSTDL